MEISAEKILDSLKAHEEIPHVLIIWGEEEYYKDKIIKAVLAETFAGVPEQDREITVFDKELPFKDLEAAINTYPFFSGKSMVIIKEPKILKQDKRDRDQTVVNKQKV